MCAITNNETFLRKRSIIFEELPVIVRRMDGKEDILKIFTYLVDADVPF